MPPKKEEPKKRVILGRFKHNLKMGIVGLPNVGKSTFFNTLTKLNVPAENYPFCTINPNDACINIPDERFTWLCEKYQPKSEIPASLTVTDIAGLVRGAHEGQGLGNQFLSNIQAVDGIFHVVRVFEDEDVIHVEGAVEPVRDLQIIAEELLLKDIDTITKHVDGLEKLVKRGLDKQAKKEYDFMIKLQKHMKDDRKPVHAGDWSTEEIVLINTCPVQFLTAKPVVYLVNMSKDDYKRRKNRHLTAIAKWVSEYDGGQIIPFSAELERQVVEYGGWDTPEGAEFLKKEDMQSALPKIIKTGFQTLNLLYYFTCGEDEVKCWVIKRGYTAPQAAGVIHTDFEQYFICAEVMKYDSLKEHGTENAVKAAGLYKQQGKTYEVEDGDIIYFKINEGAAATQANKNKVKK
eukprot:TRINITY_DN576_c0_g1::TRINITY_DN576_c0_g1_i1::g.10514::m.10514 TRINITY_DN576_c0_g1::TRINITY_DN576_c0_g1_i1::g.10514  ORF type:complete len:425 (+),score=195.64,sp/Q9SA73/OLA1_ARATH/60.05/8e-167,YchF-GTPase_C/PF06071.8/1e-35,MMR_HSR1/PF01926.18/4.5e-17,FeoB_N/PF02421.13/2.8e-06,AAA_18/PF13238.1/9.6,AAA_18/PF13238.1/3.5,TGS/PF02824.16/2.7e+03,TGS/PF02824.16/0.055,AAA_17/PF13207.1/0.84,AAA_17/PF13207.1/2.4e+02,AAA_14/PF13173.1/0.38,AAA_14/PF13173.1/5.5e+03 TRINITY_DN576_c0_g1_i1:61-1275(+)